MGWPISQSRYSVNAPVDVSLFQDIITQIGSLSGGTATNYIYGGAPLILNGSFEIDNVAQIQSFPSNWTFVNGSNTSGSLINVATNGTSPDNGQYAYQITLTNANANGTLYYTQGSGFNVGGVFTPQPNGSMAISIDQAYDLNIDYYISSTNVQLSLVVWFYSPSGTLVSTVPIPTTGTISNLQVNTWSSLKVSIFPPNNFSTTLMAFAVKVSTLAGAPAGSYYCTLDNIYCTLRNNKGNLPLNTASALTTPYSTSAQLLSGFVSFSTNSALATTYVVPQGVFTLKARLYGQAFSSSSSNLGALGGYCENNFAVLPGLSITVNIAPSANIGPGPNQTTASTCTISVPAIPGQSSFTMVANGATSKGGGTATSTLAGTLLIPGGSTLTTATIILEPQ